MAADPTMDLIRSMDTEPDKWVCTTVVAFVPHERHFPAADGKPAVTVKMTEAGLREEAEKANDRVRKTGRLDTLTIGHRRFEAAFPETQQPPLVGFVRNYQVQWVQREAGRMLALVYDEYAARDRAAEYDLYRQFPFRSAEYDPNLGLAGVAALVRPPALNMGTTYLYEATPMADAKPDDDKWDEEDTKQYAAFEAAMKSYGARCGKYMKKYAAATGGTLPYQAPVVAPVVTVTPPVVPPAPVPAQVATYAADLAAVRQQLEVERTARVKAECRALLDPFKTVLKFDYDRELAALTALDDAGRAGHLKYMADTYQTLPTGSMIQVYQGNPLPAAGAGKSPDVYRAPEGYDAVMAHVRANPGITYEAAKAAVAARK